MAKARKKPEHDLFYEAMPATADQYRFGPQETEEPVVSPEDLSDHERLTVDDTKTTAVITLILTAVVALGLVFLFIQGLEMVKGATPTTTNPVLEQHQP